MASRRARGCAPPGKGEAALRLRRGGELLGQGRALGAPVPAEEAQQRQQGEDGKEYDNITNGAHGGGHLLCKTRGRALARPLVYFFFFFLSKKDFTPSMGPGESSPMASP